MSTYILILDRLEKVLKNEFFSIPKLISKANRIVVIYLFVLLFAMWASEFWHSIKNNLYN